MELVVPSIPRECQGRKWGGGGGVESVKKACQFLVRSIVGVA